MCDKTLGIEDKILRTEAEAKKRWRVGGGVRGVGSLCFLAQENEINLAFIIERRMKKGRKIKEEIGGKREMTARWREYGSTTADVIGITHLCGRAGENAQF